MNRSFLNKNPRKVSSSVCDRRISILAVVIFLIGGITIFRLFSLQIINHDLYLALAAGQHEISESIMPERGKIFIQEVTDDSENRKLYPLATNQSLYLVYAEPNRIEEDRDKVAEKILNILIEDDLIEKEDSKEEEQGAENEMEGGEDGEGGEEEAKAEKDEETDKKDNGKYSPEEESLFYNFLSKLTKENDPYEPLKKNVPEKTVEKIRDLKITGIGFIEERERFYPEKSIGSHFLGFVSKSEEEKTGQYGLEGYFEKELGGEKGFLEAEKDVAGRWIPISGRNWEKAQDGVDLVLTIDRNIQFFVCEKLKQAVEKHDADGGSVVVMDPKTGAIWAMCSFPDFDPNDYSGVKNIDVFNNPAIFYQYEPGSIFKAITIAAALDTDKITPTTTYNDEGFLKIDGHTIRNSDLKAHGVQTMTQVLDESLNTGVVFALNKMGVDAFRRYVNDFGFGIMTGIELDYEASGNVKSLEKKGDIWGATASFGQGVSVTPIQMISAFASLANNGKLMKPYIVDEVIQSTGEKIKTSPKMVRQVVSARTSTLIGGMLVSVVENGHGNRAGVPGYYVAGKTGTAQVPKKDGVGYEKDITIGSFLGFAPVEDPRFVMLTKIDHPRDAIWAESSAAPLFGEIAKYMLNYLRVPPNRK